MHFIEVKNILTSSGGYGMNVYRGCTHGCIYCDSRSRCYHIDHQFEDIAVKKNALQLLEKTLMRKRNKCMIGTGSMCDPYLPIEKDLRITRQCLEIIEKYNFGATVLTKSNLVMRDLDLLSRIHARTKAVLQMTLTTYDEALCRIVEPNVSSTKERFETLCAFRDSGIPTVVWLDPILPFINDTMENLEGIMDYCIRAGVKGIVCFEFGMTLREGNREYYYEKLDRHFPGVRHRYEQYYGTAYSLTSPDASALFKRFSQLCVEHDIMYGTEKVFSYIRSFDTGKKNDAVDGQGLLFDF